MTDEALYELVVDAVRVGLAEAGAAGDIALHRRMVGGAVAFRDNEGKVIKEIPAVALFKKVTAIREKLRVLEQKLNNNDRLDDADKAEYQALVTRCYGSLTTFNFLFRDEEDKFVGSGG